MREANFITAWQFAFFRIIFGVFLTSQFICLAFTQVEPANAPFAHLLTQWAGQEAGVTGMHVGLWIGGLLAILYVLGFARRLVAVGLLCVWLMLMGDQIVSGTFCSPFYTGLLLFLSICIPSGEPLCVHSVENVNWRLPQWIYWGAWGLLTGGYLINGLLNLYSHPWLNGAGLQEAGAHVVAQLLLLLGAVGGVLFGVLSFCKRCRVWLWSWMLSIQILLNFSQGVDYAIAGLVFTHIFVWDPRWLQSVKDGCLRIVFYDGECGLCNRTVQFLMAIDGDRVLRFAPLQGETAAVLLPSGCIDLQQLDTLVYAVCDNGKLVSMQERSNAVLTALHVVGGIGRFIALLQFVPRPVRDAGYGVVAKNRWRLGNRVNCRLPTSDERQRLLP